MKKFLGYLIEFLINTLRYLIKFLINTLPITAPFLIIFFSFYLLDFLSISISNFYAKTVGQILIIIIFLTLILAPFWYIRLFQIFTGNYYPKKTDGDGEYLTNFESGCLAYAIAILLGIFFLFKSWKIL